MYLFLIQLVILLKLSQTNTFFSKIITNKNSFKITIYDEIQNPFYSEKNPSFRLASMKFIILIYKRTWHWDCCLQSLRMGIPFIGA